VNVYNRRRTDTNNRSKSKNTADLVSARKSPSQIKKLLTKTRSYSHTSINSAFGGNSLDVDTITADSHCLKITFTTDSTGGIEAFDDRYTALNDIEPDHSVDDLLSVENESDNSDSIVGDGISFGTVDNDELSVEYQSEEKPFIHTSTSNQSHMVEHEIVRRSSISFDEDITIREERSESIETNSVGMGSNHESSSTTRATLRWALYKCTNCLTRNFITNYMIRLPTAADAMPSTPTLILDNPKMAFLVMMVACLVFDLIIILPGYLLAKVVTEYVVYVLIALSIWFIGRCVLRIIAFPGSTARLRNEIEGEFAKYSVRMLRNATESCVDLATLLISTDSANMYSSEIGRENQDHDKTKATAILGNTYGRFDVIPLWKKVQQYRNRVIGMYHDVLNCLLNSNGDGKISESSFTKHMNNALVGDIGKLVSVSRAAKSKGFEIHGLLGKLMDEIESLESCASSYLNSDMKTLEHKTLSREAIRASQKLLIACNEFTDCLNTVEACFIKSQDSGKADDEDSEDSYSMQYRRNRTSAFGEAVASIKEGASTLIDMVDPPPFKAIFGLDVLRGAVLSRFRGSRQIWVPRPKSDGGGMVDAIYIPADGKDKDLLDNSTRLGKVVLFCNPNAGLLEAATGLSIIGGNVVEQSSDLGITCWTDFYLDNGFDIIVFNYSGYGRSHVGNRKKTLDDATGAFHFFRRVGKATFFSFKPSPSSLKADATAVATYLIENVGVEKFVIHGESIGGMAASGAARVISNKENFDTNSTPTSYPTLLVCDRTFCYLNAVASRLVGSWTESILPLLTPFWNTNVAADFAAARCRKVIAQDAADIIIHDSSSLKKGIANAKEFKNEQMERPHDIGPVPVEYRMSDHENVGVLESSTIKAPNLSHLQAPTYPSNRHFRLMEAFHFAACARRIGKVATSFRKKKIIQSMSFDDNEEGIEIPAIFSRDEQDDTMDEPDDSDVILEMWEVLARCDGVAGMPLGGAVKEGHDSVVDWCSCFVVLGCQRVALAAESRIRSLTPSNHVSFENIVVEKHDFDFYYPEYSKDENGSTERLPPLPLPEVLLLLKDITSKYDEQITEVKHEIDYCINILQYIMDRISCKETVLESLKAAHFQDCPDGFCTGRFLNLSCGHNNQFSIEERISFAAILNEALESGHTIA